MKKVILIACMLLTFFTGCAQKQPEVLRTVQGNFKTYDEMSDGTWRADGIAYQYRLELSGRVPTAVQDVTFVYLSNIKTITFEQAWKASGYSSSFDDYFSSEKAVLVEVNEVEKELENETQKELISETINESENETINETINKVDKENSYEQISQKQAKELMDSGQDLIILDVRTAEEYAEGHIKNAILIPDYEIESKAETILKEKEQLILVYCRSGRRSKIASEKLVELGYRNVKEFGGIIDWEYGVVNIKKKS